ncbi:class F sortase [Ornithinimicrobium sp. Arc0846-15]|nr:class F sortase [Ornithinimicrobium laminariae]
MSQAPAHRTKRGSHRAHSVARRTPVALIVGLAMVGTVGAGWIGGQVMTGTQSAAEASGASGVQGSIALHSEQASSGSSDLPAVQQGTEAASARTRFVPTEVTLPSEQTASVHTATTIGGELVVPENADDIGWWDGSAYAGDPFGNTVLAGHVDDPEGPGFFGELLSVSRGDVITVNDGAEAIEYQVTEINEIDKSALASNTDTFDQRGEHQLVMITCSGAWQPDLNSYANNTVVIAEPVETQ